MLMNGQMKQDAPRRRRRNEKGPHKPTIADVAKVAGVSAAAVSYVLNGRTQEVSKQTAERVMRVVRELGYVKNLAAAALTGQKSRMLAVIMPGLFDPRSGAEQAINPFFGEFLVRLEAEARARRYAVCFYSGREEDYVHFLLERSMDAAVLVGFSEWDLPGVLQRRDVRCILYDSFGQDTLHGHVRTDEVKGGYLAAERLMDIGKRRIVFAGAQPTEQSNNVPSARYRGALKACQAASATLDRLEIATSYEAGVAAARSLVEMNADGVVCTADIIAAGLVEGLARLGKSIPDEMAVMGYDNLPVCTYTRPHLSTIDQGLRAKVHAVMDLVENPAPGDVRVVDPVLVVRESA
jgi:DNA-binding LacI/PurR family transcriptional regulator